MAATPIRRHRPGAGAGPDLRAPGQAPHLALVSEAAAPIEHERPSRTPEQAFGARLRSARERRGITVRAVADRTKVSASLFEALERGDISRWPKGIYKRSFLRGYADVVGLPTDSTLEEFLRLFPDETPDPIEIAPAVAIAGGPAIAIEHGAALRLTLAATNRPSFLQHLSGRAALDTLTVTLLALLLSWWAGFDAATTAAVLALCYYPHAARQVRRLAASSRARSRSPRAAAAEAPGGVAAAAAAGS
jgi:transcriptional regulator with XRE-family HTH domain